MVVGVIPSQGISKARETLHEFTDDAHFLGVDIYLII